MLIVNALLLSIGGLLWLAVISDLTSLIRVAVARPRRINTGDDFIPRLLFLIPAHNEEGLIARCVHSLQEMAYPARRILVVVVADNCSDRTATLARGAGAICLERHDSSDLGKPAAIAWALSQLSLEGFDALVILDADSIVEPGFAREISAIGNLRSVAVQAFDGVSNPEESSLTQMAAVLALAHHGFAYRLKEAAGLNVPLTGTGMCIGVDVLGEHGWNVSALTEDLEYYIVLTLAGVRTHCCPGAHVLSVEAATPRSAISQRHRWSRGRLEVALKHLRAVLKSRRVGTRQKLDLVAELLTPGPATHLALVAVVAMAAGSLQLANSGWIVTLAAGSLLRPVTYGALGVSAVPDRLAAAGAFLTLPWYAAWRLGIQLFSLFSRPTWTRSRR